MPLSEVEPSLLTLAVDRAHAENLGGKHVDEFCEACADTYLVLNVLLIDTEWACHPTPDKKRWMSFHGKSSVHMSGCHRAYVIDYGEPHA